MKTNELWRQSESIRGLKEAIKDVETQVNSININKELAKKKLVTGKLSELAFESSISTQKGLLLRLTVDNRFKRYKIVCPIIQSRLSGIEVSNTGVLYESSGVLVLDYESIFGILSVPDVIIGRLFIYLQNKMIFGVVDNEYVFIFKLGNRLNIYEASFNASLSNNILDFNFSIESRLGFRTTSNSSIQSIKLLISLRDYSIIGIEDLG